LFPLVNAGFPGPVEIGVYEYSSYNLTEGGNLGVGVSPANPFVSGTNWGFFSWEAVTIFAVDTLYWVTNDANVNGVYDWQIYRFNISQEVDNITELKITWMGHSSRQVANYDLSAFYWSDTDNSWELLGTMPSGSNPDVYFIKTLNTNISDYINEISTGKFLYVMARYKHKPGGGGGSCPFIYSYNSSGWNFDHEAFPFSVIEPAQATTFDRLKYMEEVGGEYKLRIAEELEEISYVDEFKLHIVDHLGSGFVMPDIDGNIHTIQNLNPATFCIDNELNDCLTSTNTPDDNYWTQNFDLLNTSLESTWTSEINFVFDKPLNEDNVKIFFNVKKNKIMTNAWGYYLDLIGENNWNNWENTISFGPISTLFNNVFDEIINLKFEVWDGNSWEEVGSIKAGNHILDDFLIDVDLTGMNIDSDDELLLRASSLRGFYQINYMAVDYSANENMIVTEVEPKTALLNGLINVSEELSGSDKDYVVLEQGNIIELVYDAIPENVGYNRDYSISIEGYYNFINYNNRTTLEFGEGAIDWVNSLLTPEEIPIFLFNRGVLEDSDSLHTNFVQIIVETNESTCVPPAFHYWDWYVNCSEGCIIDEDIPYLEMEEIYFY